MTVKVKFQCDECDAEAWGTPFLRREFHGVTGKPWGFGHWAYDQAADVAPAGWVAFDPYTGCCYCPDCWAEIAANTEQAEAL